MKKTLFNIILCSLFFVMFFGLNTTKAEDVQMPEAILDSDNGELGYRMVDGVDLYKSAGVKPTDADLYSKKTGEKINAYSYRSLLLDTAYKDSENIVQTPFKSDEISMSAWVKVDDMVEMGRTDQGLEIFSLRWKNDIANNTISVMANQRGRVQLTGRGVSSEQTQLVVKSSTGIVEEKVRFPLFTTETDALYESKGDVIASAFEDTGDFAQFTVTRGFDADTNTYTLKLYINAELTHIVDMAIPNGTKHDLAQETLLLFGGGGGGRLPLTATYAHTKVYAEELSQEQVTKLYEDTRDDFYEEGLRFELGINNNTIPNLINSLGYQPITAASNSIERVEATGLISGEDYTYIRLKNVEGIAPAKNIIENNMSFETWWSPFNTLTESENILRIDNDGNLPISLLTDNGALVVKTGEDTVYKASDVISQISNWYHVVMTCENGEIILYLNGEKLENEIENPVSIPETDYSDYNIILGDATATVSFKDARVYAKVLSENDVKEKYNVSSGFLSAEKIFELGYDEEKLINGVNNTEAVLNGKVNKYIVDGETEDFEYIEFAKDGKAKYTIDKGLKNLIGILIYANPKQIDGKSEIFNLGNKITAEVGSDGAITFDLNGTIFSSVSELNRWIKIEIVSDGKNADVYINGMALGEKPVSGLTLDKGAEFTIGAKGKSTIAYRVFEIYNSLLESDDAAYNFYDNYKLTEVQDLPIDFYITNDENGLHIIPTGSVTAVTVKNVSVEVPVRVNADGTYTAIPSATGAYTVTVSGNGYELKKEIDYVNLESFEALKKINDTDDNEEFTNILINNAGKLGVDIKEYSDLSTDAKTMVNSILIKTDFSANENDTEQVLEKQVLFNNIFVDCVLTAYLKSVVDAQKILSVIEKYNINKAEKITNDKYCSSITSWKQVALAFVKQSRDNIVINDMTGVYKAIRSAIMMYTLDNTSYTRLVDVIEYYNEESISDIDLLKYSSLSQGKQATVLQKFKTNHGETPEQAKEKFSDAVNAAMVNNNTSSNGGGSGYGGGSSKKNTVPSVAIFKNEIDAVKKPEKEENIMFSDVSDEHWAYESITGLADNGVVNGKGNNLFKPDGLLTREEFVKMVVASLGLNVADTKTNFADVAESEWYAPYICAAVEADLINGVSENEFGVGKFITREDVAVIISRAFKLEKKLIKKQFKDISHISDYALEAVELLVGNGIIDGFDDGSFLPKNNATRAQIAKLLWTTLQKVKG